jgi:hypothetical protein
MKFRERLSFIGYQNGFLHTKCNSTSDARSSSLFSPSFPYALSVARSFSSLLALVRHSPSRRRADNVITPGADLKYNKV